MSFFRRTLLFFILVAAVFLMLLIGFSDLIITPLNGMYLLPVAVLLVLVIALIISHAVKKYKFPTADSTKLKPLVIDKELEVSLRSERDKLSAIFESIGEGVVVLDKALNITAMNPVGQRLLGMTEAELLGKFWYDIVTTYIGNRKIGINERTVYKVMKTGVPRQSKLEDDHYFETINRKKFPVVTTTTPYQATDSTGVIVVYQDATQQKDVRERIEQLVVERTEELHQAEARLISSIKGLEIGFIMTDPHQQVLMINDAALKFIHSDDEPAEFDTGDGVHLATIENIAKSIIGKCDLVKELHTSIVKAKKITINNVAVGHRDLQIFITPVMLDNKAIGAVVVLVDITVAKQLDRAKDDFLSIASHELRTPLTAIMGNASMIEQYFSDQIKDEDLKSMLSDMKTASTRLIDLVNDFLSVSRLEQGRMVIKPENFSISNMVKQVLEELKANTKPGLKIVAAESADKIIFADPAKTKEVFINLLGNAIKYSEKGEIKISWEGSGMVTVRVTDTGIGIAPNDQLRLFKKFQQAGTSSITRDTTRSSGLGLYISKLLTENMGGKIGLEKSIPNVGSTFFFTLPSGKKDLNKK